jgi:hypothetical protein
MIARLPFDIREAIIQVCGRAFWYKDPHRAFLASVGVPQQLIERFAAEPKFPMARHTLAEIDELGEDGWAIERRLLTELCKLRRIPDEGVEDKDSALQTLRHLKKLAIDQGLIAEEERSGRPATPSRCSPETGRHCCACTEDGRASLRLCRDGDRQADPARARLLTRGAARSALRRPRDRVPPTVQAAHRRR